MNPKNLELLNIALLAFILIDYIIKYRNKLNSNSFIWITECITISILSVIDIAIYYSIGKPYQGLLVLFGYIFAIIPILLYCDYIEVNYMNSEKRIYKQIGLAVYFIIYSVIISMFYVKHPINAGVINFLTEYDYNYIFMSLIILPVIIVFIRSIFNRKFVDRKAYIALLLPIVGAITDLVFDSEMYLSFSYSFTALLLYMFKYDSSLNKDALTGANNRRYFDNYNYLSDKMYAVFMIDVDDFKKINDMHGHDMGDKILRDIVDVLRTSVRTTDSVIRLGGDEFSIIATIKHEDDIKIINKRINENTKMYNMTHDIPFSLSIGSGVYDSMDDFSSFLKRIDSKMYRKKRYKKIKNNEEKEN